MSGTHQCNRCNRVGVFRLFVETAIFRQVFLKQGSQANVPAAERRIRAHDFIIEIHGVDGPLEPRGILNREKKL